MIGLRNSPAPNGSPIPPSKGRSGDPARSWCTLQLNDPVCRWPVGETVRAGFSLRCGDGWRWPLLPITFSTGHAAAWSDYPRRSHPWRKQARSLAGEETEGSEESQARSRSSSRQRRRAERRRSSIVTPAKRLNNLLRRDRSARGQIAEITGGAERIAEAKEENLHTRRSPYQGDRQDGAEKAAEYWAHVNKYMEMTGQDGTHRLDQRWLSTAKTMPKSMPRMIVDVADEPAALPRRSPNRASASLRLSAAVRATDAIAIRHYGSRETRPFLVIRVGGAPRGKERRPGFRIIYPAKESRLPASIPIPETVKYEDYIAGIARIQMGNKVRRIARLPSVSFDDAGAESWLRKSARGGAIRASFPTVRRIWITSRKPRYDAVQQDRLLGRQADRAGKFVNKEYAEHPGLIVGEFYELLDKFLKTTCAWRILLATNGA